MSSPRDPKLTELVQRLDRLESQLALQRLVANSTQCIDTGDRAQFAAGWWDDSVWNLGAPFEPFGGIDLICERAEELLWTAWASTHHVVGNVDVALAADDIDCATLTSEVIALTVLPTGLVHLVAATYHDTCTRRAGEWRIARRDVATRLASPLPGVRAQSLEEIVR